MEEGGSGRPLVCMEMSEGPPSGENAPGRRGRAYLKYAVGVLAAFGILGAVGSRVVDKVFSSAEAKLNPESLVLFGVTEDPGGGSDGFEVASRSAAGLDAKLRRESRIAES